MEYPSLYLAAAGILEAGRRLYARGLVAGRDGNLSVRIGPDRVLVTPANVSKGFMTPEDLAVVDMRGKPLGEGTPSTETPLHLALYLALPELGAVLHAHPPTATAFAAAGRLPGAAGLQEAVSIPGGTVLAPPMPQGSRELAEGVAKLAPGHGAALLARHGAVTWGPDMREALFRMESLEALCAMELCLARLGETP